jgi:hypothetical protein
MLNYIEYKMKEELQFEIHDPTKSFALELLYLFNDFLIINDSFTQLSESIETYGMEGWHSKALNIVKLFVSKFRNWNADLDAK